MRTQEGTQKIWAEDNNLYWPEVRLGARGAQCPEDPKEPPANTDCHSRPISSLLIEPLRGEIEQSVAQGEAEPCPVLLG